MKRRITYLTTLDDASQSDSSLFHISPKSFSIHPQHQAKLNGSKEDRVTFALDELPSQLVSILKQCHELHIRWASSQPYSTQAPFASRISPGLHIFVTLQESSSAATSHDSFCHDLKKFFGGDIKCSTSDVTFTPLMSPSSSLSHSTTHQYYQPIASAQYFIDVLANLTPASSFVTLVSSVTTHKLDSLDLSYTALSHSLVLSTYHSSPPNLNTGWNETITKLISSRTEIGVLSPAPALPSTSNEDIDAHSITLSGGLIVLGESDKLSRTLFSTPSRHHSFPAFFFASFKQPTGLHPTLSLSFPDASALRSPQPAHARPKDKEQECSLHAHLTLPSAVFIDKYAFRDALFLSSHNLTALRSLTGADDLELPDWKIEQWGSAALFELSSPPIDRLPSSSPSHDPGAIQAAHSITIPLHSRYLPPSHTSGYAHVDIPYPVVFWACSPPPSPSPGSDPASFATNPFDRTHLGYDGLFEEGTAFYHLTPIAAPNTLAPAGAAAAAPSAANKADGKMGQQAQSLMLDLTVPVLDLSHWSARFIEPATLSVVMLGFAWVVWCLFRPLPVPKALDVDKRQEAVGNEDGKKEK